MTCLSEIPTGKRCIIERLDGDKRFLSRVTSMGLTIGCTVDVISNEKKQPVLIYGRDTMIALNRKESDKIKVRGIK